MSFFKSNTTTTTNATTNEANQETGNNNGGLLKGVAIAVGTVAGIGLAAFGGTKAYKHFHVKDENRLDDVTDNEAPAENAEDTTNETTVESFNEVDTEETNESAPVEAEEAKTEETNNEAPVEAEGAKTEETKNEAPVEDEKPSATQLVDQLETEASVFEKEMVLPIEVKTGIEQMDFLMGLIAQCRRTIGDNARISVALCKMQNGVKDFWLGINAKLARQASELESLDVIEDLFGADMDMVDRAYFDMQYINKSTLVLGTKDATVQLFNRLVRVADKMSKKSSTKSTGETQTVENAFDVFKDGHKESNKVDGETKTSTKPSVGENQTTENCFDAFKEGHKETNKVEHETKSSTKKVTGETKTAEPVVDEKQATTKEVPSETKIGNSTVISDDGETVTLAAEVSQESINNVNDVINIVSVIPDREHPEKNDMPYFIRVIGGRIRGIKEPEATFVAYDEASKSNKFMDACVDVCNMTGTAICNLANSGKNPLASMQWIDRCTNELVASGIIDNTYDPNTYRAAILKAHKEAMDALSKLVSGETKTDNKSSGETKTEETLTYTMSEKIQEAVQQSDETAATAAPEPENQAPMSPEASSLALKLQEVGELMRAEKWSEAAEFYKTQLTPYLADDGLSKELRDEIMGIKTKATNMLMSQKQLEAKQKAASAKASKKSSKKNKQRRRH